MRRSAFADLCGVSKQMISKYAGDNLVVEADGDVDAAATLALLEGRLNEDKRQAALATLAQIAPAAAAPTHQPSARAPTVASFKVQKDEIEMQLKRLQLGREAGELVSADAVDQAASVAINAMRENFGNRRREMSERICLDFGLPPEKATALARLLGREFEMTLGAFGEHMSALAAADASQPEPASAVATA